MKKTPRFLMFVLTIFTVLLGACSGTATPLTSIGGDKVQAMPVAFTGLVQSITGNQWVINGQAITVDPTVVRDGPFNVGDRIKLEGVVNQDGSFTLSGVKTPSAQDLSTLPLFGGGGSSNDANSNDDNEDNSNINDNANANDANSNDDNSDDENVNDDNDNDDNSNDANVNDDNGSNDNEDDSSVNDNTNSSDEDNGGNDNGGGGSDDGGGNDDGGGGGNDNDG